MAKLQIPVTPHDHIRGSASAPITLVEYGDFECPACQLAHPTTTALQRHFGPKLRFVFRHFPLKEIHPFAEPAAETAEFAGSLRRFWEMHDRIYERVDALSLRVLLALTARLDLPESKLREAWESGEFEPRVHRDFLGGIRSGVNGTPTFFINGEPHEGSYDFAVIASAIDLKLHAIAL